MGYRIFHARTPPLTTIQVVEFHWAGSVPVEIEEVRPPSQKMSSKKKTELLELGRTVGTGCLLIDFCHEDASRTCFFFFWVFQRWWFFCGS